MTISMKIPEAELRALDDKMARLPPLVNRSPIMKAGMKAAGKTVVDLWKKKIPARPRIAGRKMGVFRKALTVKVVEYKTTTVAIVGAPHAKAPHEWLLEFGHELHVPRRLWKKGRMFLTRKHEPTVHVGRVEPKGYGEQASTETRTAQVRALNDAASKAITKALAS